MNSKITKTALIAVGVTLLASSAFAAPKCRMPRMAMQQIDHMKGQNKEKIMKTYKDACVKYHRIRYNIHAKKAMLNALLVQPKIDKAHAHKIAKELAGLYKKKVMLLTNSRIKLNEMGLKFTPSPHKPQIKHKK